MSEQMQEDVYLEREPREAPVFVVLDLDRTLIDNDVLVNIIFDVLPEMGYDESVVEGLIRVEHENKGNSFDLFGYLEQTSSRKVNLSTLKDHILARRPEDLVYDGVEELLDELSTAAVPHGIMTYGSMGWQSAKIDLFRALAGSKTTTLSALITNEKNKAEYIDAHWYSQERSRFTIPKELSGLEKGVAVSSVLIIDDKPTNFETSNSHIHGQVVDNSDKESGCTIDDISSSIGHTIRSLAA
jgi:hypothetical protein